MHSESDMITFYREITKTLGGSFKESSTEVRYEDLPFEKVHYTSEGATKATLGRILEQDEERGRYVATFAIPNLTLIANGMRSFWNAIASEDLALVPTTTQLSVRFYVKQKHLHENNLRKQEDLLKKVEASLQEKRDELDKLTRGMSQVTDYPAKLALN